MIGRPELSAAYRALASAPMADETGSVGRGFLDANSAAVTR